MCHSKSRFFIFLLISVCIFSSCSFIGFEKDDYGSVTFQFSEEFVKSLNKDSNLQKSDNQGMRDAFSSSAETLFFEIELKGGYNAKQVIPVTSSVKVTFDGISVGTRLWAEISIYKYKDSQKVVYYSGKSDPVIITNGINQIPLKLKKSGEGEYLIYIYINPDSSVGNDESGDGSEEKPYESITAALRNVKDPKADYVIIVDGVISGEVSQIICDEKDEVTGEVINTLSASSIRFVGKKEDGTDGISFEKVSTTEYALDVQTKIPVHIQNMTISTKSYALHLVSDGNLIFDDSRLVYTGTGDAGYSFLMGTLILNGNSEISGFKGSRCLYIANSSTRFIMNDNSKIYDCHSENGGAVYILNGEMEMNDHSSIYNCSSTENGGAAVIDYGKLIMRDYAKIENCEAAKNGGGVHIRSSCFTMSDNAVIKDCFTDAENGMGGGIYSESMTNSEMTGHASVENCHAEKGGGLYLIVLSGTSSFSLKDDAGIVGCRAKQGAGIFSPSNGLTIDFTAGKLSGNSFLEPVSDENKGCGIYANSATVWLGSNTILDEDNDISIQPGWPITIKSPVKKINTMQLSVTSFSNDAPLVYRDADTVSESELENTVEKINLLPYESSGGTTYGLIDAKGYLRKLKTSPDAVGDIVFNDGKALGYNPNVTNLTLTNTQKAKAIAVVFHNNTDCSEDSNKRILGVGLKHGEKRQWCTENAKFYGKMLESIKGENGTSGSGQTMTYYFNNNINGKENFAKISEFLSNQENNTTDDTDESEKYPAFYFAKNYAEIEGSNVSDTEYASGWWLPSTCELYQIGLNRETVNAALTICERAVFDGTVRYYWSASQYELTPSSSYAIDFASTLTIYGSPVQAAWTSKNACCAIREF